MANNLEQQGGTWHVRLAIPADVQKAFGGRKVLSKSLETGQRSEAMNRRLPYLAQWKAEIAAARAQAKAPKEDWRPKLAAFSEQHLADFNARVLNAVSPAGAKKLPIPSLVDNELSCLIGDYPADVPTLMRISDQSRQFATALITYGHDLTTAEQDEANAIALDPTHYKPKSPITKARLAEFRTVREKSVAAKNVDQQESKLQKLSAFLAETGKPLDFDSIATWLDSLGVASKTKAQYINAGATFWKWAMKYDVKWREDFKGAANPFENHDLPQARGREKADAQRQDFSLADLAKLHNAAQAKGLDTLADLILLAAYTGARIEELCQLSTENVVTVEQVPSFDIVDSKTVAGIRAVPVHPALIELVQRLMDKSQDGFLVPSTSKNKYGNRSDLYSKAFGRLKKSLGFGDRHVFHSIRKTAITQLVRADVPGPLIAELVGHETGTMTYDIYSQGASAAQKLAAISKIPTLPEV
ncbi:integrase [Pseudomonas putida]|nr:integrase [Pseudomonas putida]